MQFHISIPSFQYQFTLYVHSVPPLVSSAILSLSLQNSYLCMHNIFFQIGALGEPVSKNIPRWEWEK